MANSPLEWRTSGLRNLRVRDHKHGLSAALVRLLGRRASQAGLNLPNWKENVFAQPPRTLPRLELLVSCASDFGTCASRSLSSAGHAGGEHALRASLGSFRLVLCQAGEKAASAKL